MKNSAIDGKRYLKNLQNLFDYDFYNKDAVLKAMKGLVKPIDGTNRQENVDWKSVVGDWVSITIDSDSKFFRGKEYMIFFLGMQETKSNRKSSNRQITQEYNKNINDSKGYIFLIIEYCDTNIALILLKILKDSKRIKEYIYSIMDLIFSQINVAKYKNELSQAIFTLHYQVSRGSLDILLDFLCFRYKINIESESCQYVINSQDSDETYQEMINQKEAIVHDYDCINLIFHRYNLIIQIQYMNIAIQSYSSNLTKSI